MKKYKSDGSDLPSKPSGLTVRGCPEENHDPIADPQSNGVGKPSHKNISPPRVPCTAATITVRRASRVLCRRCSRRAGSSPPQVVVKFPENCSLVRLSYATEV